ncbi:hypothetical protein R6Q59_018809 [Mikania micrantha]
MKAQLTAELIESTEANKKLILREKSFDKKIIDLGKENEDLKIKVLQNNHAVSVHLESVQKLKVEVSAAKAEAELHKSKLENYQNSQYVIDYFASLQRSSNDNTGLGFHFVPPPPSYVSRPQLNPDLEVHPVSLKKIVSDQVTEDVGSSSSLDKVFVDCDAPIIEDITESEYLADILRHTGYHIKTVEKKSLKFQKSKSEMKPSEKAVVKSTVVSKPVLKVKTATTIKPSVFVKSSTTYKGETSGVSKKQNGFSEKVNKVVDKVVDKGVSHQAENNNPPEEGMSEVINDDWSSDDDNDVFEDVVSHDQDVDQNITYLDHNVGVPQVPLKRFVGEVRWTEMANLTFGDKHNVCAYLDPTTRNDKDFRPMIEFLKRSRIYHAISNSCQIYQSHIQSFWESARLISVDEEYVIEANVLGQAIRITEADIRRVLQFGGEPADNITKAKDRFYMYPRFVQMLIDERLPEQMLPRDAVDLLKLKHMTDSSLGQVRVYQKSGDDVLEKDLVGHYVRANYIAPEGDAWRHAEFGSDTEAFSDDDDNQPQPPPPPPRQQPRKSPAQSSRAQQQSQSQTQGPSVTSITLVPLDVIFPDQQGEHRQQEDTSVHVDVVVEDEGEESSDTDSELETIVQGSTVIKRMKKRTAPEQSTEAREERADPDFVAEEPESSRPKKMKRMAKGPPKKKAKSPKIIVSSSAVTSIASSSIPVVTSSPATTVPIFSSHTTIPVSVSTVSGGFGQAPEYVNVASFVPSFMETTTVTTSFQETSFHQASTSRDDSLFESLDDLGDLNFTVDYDDTELRRRISMRSKEFNLYKMEKEKAKTDQPSSSGTIELDEMERGKCS